MALVLLALTVAGAVAGCRIRQERLLTSWGLPADLLTRQAQLETLALPPRVEDLSWVSGSVKEGIARGTKVDRLDGLPRDLEALDISHTDVRALPELPGRLRSLDLRWTLIGDYGDRLLESNLRSLKLGGRRVMRLPNLPPTLERLELADTELRDVRGLPPALRSLRLVGATFKDLGGLPADLHDLTLSGTGARSLEGLPVALQSLEDDSNDYLKLDHLPPFLSQLSVRRRHIGDFSELHFLVSLALQDGDTDQFPAWPASLRDLTLQNRQTAVIPELPTELKNLDLSGYEGRAKGRLPLGLERLVHAVPPMGRKRKGLPTVEELKTCATGMTGFRTTLTGLSVCGEALQEPIPSSVERLEICPSPEINSLTGLPAHLLDLTVAGTGLGALPEKLPGSLRALDISNTHIASLGGLKRLQNLRSLTLSEGQITTLDGMPKSVRTLVFVGSTEVAPVH